MKMQRRHYEFLAEVVRALKPRDGGPPTCEGQAWDRGRAHQWETTVDRFAEHLKTTNPNFNMEKFLEACNATN